MKNNPIFIIRTSEVMVRVSIGQGKLINLLFRWEDVIDYFYDYKGHPDQEDQKKITKKVIKELLENKKDGIILLDDLVELALNNQDLKQELEKNIIGQFKVPPDYFLFLKGRRLSKQ